jgi:hypothetical protein
MIDPDPVANLRALADAWRSVAEALVEFAVHDVSCDFDRDARTGRARPRPCDCGLQAILDRRMETNPP